MLLFLREAPGHAVEESLLDANVGTRYIEERFLGCVCRHPSQEARRMKEKNRQTTLGMTARGWALDREALRANTLTP